MHTKRQKENINKIIPLLIRETNDVCGNNSEFGYKERVRIERGLFLLLKFLCSQKLNYNLQGFGNFHRQTLLAKIVSRKCGAPFAQTIEQIFQLKVFLQALSSENSYVRGDALSRVGVEKKNVFSLIERRVRSIITKINSTNVEPGASLDTENVCGLAGQVS